MARTITYQTVGMEALVRRIDESEVGTAILLSRAYDLVIGNADIKTLDQALRKAAQILEIPLRPSERR